jgi:uncharacterized protein YbjT (DUF2867 family)
MFIHVVFGAASAQGFPVVQAAAAAGLSVRAVARTPAAVASRLAPGVALEQADLDVRSSLVPALRGAASAFLHLPIPASPDTPARQLDNFLSAAVQARLPLLVFNTSGPVVSGFRDSPLIAGNRAAVAAIHSSGVPAIILQPLLYLENVLVPLFVPRLAGEGILDYPPVPKLRRVSWTSHQDQAAIAVAAMLRPDLAGSIHAIASDEPVTADGLAERLQVWRRGPVSAEATTPEIFGQRVSAAIGNPSLAFVLQDFYRAVGDAPDDALVIDIEGIERTFGVQPMRISERIAQWGHAQTRPVCPARCPCCWRRGAKGRSWPGA